MSKGLISELSRSLIEIAWYFGPKGLDGECCDNLTMPEFIALDKVAATPDCPVQDVGFALNFTKSGATRLVGRLEKKGYIVKVRSSLDARLFCVAITEKGGQVLESANSRYLTQFNDLVSKMTGYAYADVAALVTAMARSVKK